MGYFVTRKQSILFTNIDLKKKKDCELLITIAGFFFVVHFYFLTNAIFFSSEGLLSNPCSDSCICSASASLLLLISHFVHELIYLYHLQYNLKMLFLLE